MAKEEKVLVGFPMHPRQNVSKQNIQEYDNEKRAKTLHDRGFNQEAVAGMMQVTEHEVVKMIRRHDTKEMIRDGKL